MSEAKIVTNIDYLVTETTFEPKQPAAEILRELRERKTTGQFVIHLSEGGIQKVLLTEKTKATGKKSDQIRGVFGWEGK